MLRQGHVYDSGVWETALGWKSELSAYIWCRIRPDKTFQRVSVDGEERRVQS